MDSEFTKAEGTLSADLEQMLKTFFDKMDDDKNGEVRGLCTWASTYSMLCLYSFCDQLHGIDGVRT